MSRAEEQIRRFEVRRPLAVRLAEAVSLAVIADPPLLRKVRLDLVPGADPGTEADLWLSPLVQTRSPDGIVFAPETAEALRVRLAAEPARLKKAWQATQAMHGHLTPALRLEEEIAWLSLISKEDSQAANRIEELLRSALAALVLGERRGLAHWAARALPKLPSGVRLTQTARMLEAGAHLRLNGDARPLRGDQESPDWLPWVAPADLPRVPVAVRLFEAEVELDARPDPAGHQIQIPQTDPLLVDLSWDEPGGEGSKALQVTFKMGEMQRIPVPVQDIRLRSILGEAYDLRRAGTAPVGLRGWIIDFSEERARHRPFFGREEEERIASLIYGDSRGYPTEGKLILVTGETGSGKTAFLWAFVRESRRGSLKDPHHFFRRGHPRLESFEAAERSLIAQIAQLFPDISSIAANLRLSDVLQTLIDRKLITRDTEPFVLVLDAIDEAVSGRGAPSEGLLSMLPERLPSHMVVLASAATAEGLRLPGPVVEVPLTDAEPALREFWRQHFHQAEESVESFTRLSAGSFGVAKILRSWLEQTDGKGFFRTGRGALVTIWEELGTMVGREVRDLWLGFLATAYGPLPASLLYRLTWGERVRQTLGPLLSVQGDQRESVYGLKEEVLQGFISSHLDLSQFPRKVFLSSTVMDLRPHRDAVYSAIQGLDGYLCWRFEDFEGSPGAVVEESRRRVEDCDVFVSLVGHRRGTTPIESELSYTESEYEVAKKWGKPILLFMVADDVPLSPNLVETDAVRRRQLDFRERIAQEKIVGFFRDPQEIVRLVVTALYDFKGEEVGLAYLHRRLAEVASEAIFADDSSESARRYGLQYAAVHWLAAREVDKAFGLVTRIDFLKARCQNFGIAAARRDLQLWLDESISPQSFPDLQRSQATDLLEGLTEMAPSIAAQPAALPSFLFNYLRGKGWAPGTIRDFLRLPASEPPLRLFEPFPDDGLHRRLPVRHRGEVTGCTFIDLDGPAVLSWSKDGTLRVWAVTDGRLLTILSGHSAEVTACVELDKSRAVSASRDGSLRLWDTQEGALVRTVWGLEGETSGLLTLDPRMVVSWSTDRTIRVWDLHEGRQVMVLRGHEGSVTACVKFEELLISGSEDATLRVWALSPKGELLQTVQGHSGPVTCLALQPDGDLCASSSLDRTIRVWRLEKGSSLRHFRTLEGHSLGVLGCSFSPDGRRLASWSYDRTIRLWDFPAPWGLTWLDEDVSGGRPLGRALDTLTGHTGAVLSCAFAPEGDRLVSFSADDTMRIWAVEDGKVIATLRGHESPIRAVDFGAGRKRPFEWPGTASVVSGSADRTLRIWKGPEHREEVFLDGDNETLLCLPNSDRSRIVTVSRLGDLRSHRVDIHQIRDPEPEWLGSPSMLVGGGVVTPAGRRLVLWSRNLVEGKVRFSAWDLAYRKEGAEFYGHEGPVLMCRVTTDSRFLLSGSMDGTIGLWDLENGSQLRSFALKSPVADFRVTPDGRRVLAATWEGVWLCDLDGSSRTFLAGHTDRVLSCYIARDGLRAVTASADRTLRTWDLETGSSLAILTGHTADVTGCLITQPGQIVSRSKDGRLGLWDGESGALIAFTEGHTDWVTAFATAQTEGIFYSCSEDQTVRAWDLATGEARGVVYGVSPFRSLAAVAGGVYAGDEAGNLWVLEYGEGLRKAVA